MNLKTLFNTFLLLLPTVVSADATWLKANSAIIDEHIVPRYQQLVDATQVLEKQSNQFCGEVNEANLDKLKSAFNGAMDGWAGVQHLRYGPTELFNRYHRYQLWPDKHNTGNKQIAQLLAEGDLGTLKPDTFTHSSVAVQGFSALERLLFARGKDANAYAEAGKANYRCHLVEAISHNLFTMSAELLKEWRATPPPLEQLYLKSGEFFELDSYEHGLAETSQVGIAFYNSLYTQVQSVIDQKLLRPMGESMDSSKPRYLESWRSLRSLRNITLNLQAVESLYSVGFAPMLKGVDNGAALDKQIHQAFQHTYQAAAEIKQPLYKMLKNEKHRPEVEALLASIRQLQSLLMGDLPQALNIPLGFNALDGD